MTNLLDTKKERDNDLGFGSLLSDTLNSQKEGGGHCVSLFYYKVENYISILLSGSRSARAARRTTSRYIRDDDFDDDELFNDFFDVFGDEKSTTISSTIT